MTDRHAAYPTGLKDTPSRHRALRQRMEAPGIVVAPGAYDCITARLVEVAGFDACYITGSGVSMSALGAPDMGALSFGEILDRVRRICDSVSIPVMADADTGYGGPLNVIRTMREFERAGVSAVQLEDQEWPKKCGHEPGRKVASSQEMEQRIRAAADARVDQDVMIVARTDAIASEGFEAALERAARYREAGADILFVEAPQSVAELEAIPARLPGPHLANIVFGGKTPGLPRERLAAMGFSGIVYANAALQAAVAGMSRVLRHLAATGSLAGVEDALASFAERQNLVDYDGFAALDRRYAEPSPERQ